MFALCATDWENIFIELIYLYERKSRIPDRVEFPLVRPPLSSYEFPDHLIFRNVTDQWVESIKSALGTTSTDGSPVAYKAPWTSLSDVASESLDLLFSQAVLQNVEPIQDVYGAMFAWLKPGGYASHATGFGANDFAPYWNGPWAYTEREWRLVCGRREVVLNREPLSRQLECARQARFEIVYIDTQSEPGGLPIEDLDLQFQTFSAHDLSARGAVFILRKPAAERTR
jgi:hypothetical protein